MRHTRGRWKLKIARVATRREMNNALRCVATSARGNENNEKMAGKLAETADTYGCIVPPTVVRRNLVSRIVAVSVWRRDIPGRLWYFAVKRKR